MKSKIQLLFMVCVLAVMSLNVTASVFESNNTPGYIKKVIMRSVVDCSGYYTAFTCEHYLNYGESMAYEDFVSYNGEVTCYYTYSVNSITWIQVLPNPISPGLTIGADLNLYNSTGWVISGFQGLIRPIFSADTVTFSYNRPWFDDQYATLRGRPLNSLDREQLDRGCIGVAAAECAVKTGGHYPDGSDARIYLDKEPEAQDPRFGDAHAFRTLIDAQNFSCTNGGRKVIFAKVGVWGDNYPNGPANIPGGAPGEIPLDSVVGEIYRDIIGRVFRIFNYVTMVAGKWIDMNMCLKDAENKGTVQAGFIYDKPPQSTSGKKVMFVVRCLPPGN